MKIVILERSSVGMDADVSCFDALGEVVTHLNTVGVDETRERVKYADIVIANKAPLWRETLEGAENVKLICELATGYDNVDVPYCASRGIIVANVRDYSTAMVAQHTFALALALSEKLFHYDGYVKSGEYSSQGRFSNFDVPFTELDGKTWGVVGLGSIGRRVANIAAAFGCRVIACSPTGRAHEGYEQVDKETLFKESDVVSLHCPLSDLTRGFVGKRELAMMKNTAVLINVARGPVVDGAALAEALISGEIAAAGLDVLEKEPLEAASPLAAIKDSTKLIITPHLAWASVEARARCIDGVRRNIEAFLRGEKVPGDVR